MECLIIPRFKPMTEKRAVVKWIKFSHLSEMNPRLIESTLSDYFVKGILAFLEKLYLIA